MKRLILKDLIAWKNKKDKKPLILRGARQIGKTWILKEFAKNYFKNFIYINFETLPQISSIFEDSLEPEWIIQELGAKLNAKIDTDTLIIFDEIQMCPNALASLKYFNENAKQYNIVCAGSLLGLVTQKSFPVGQVDFLNMYPFTFSEFLIALGYERYLKLMSKLTLEGKISTTIHTELIALLKLYYSIGGMPEAIATYINSKNMSEVLSVQGAILNSIENDFNKHSTKFDLAKIKYIWQSLPSQLAKENKKFLYSVAKPGARAREYENALLWLNYANLTNMIYNVNKIALPLSFYKELTCFKIFVVDTGLLVNLSRLSPYAILEENRIFEEFKGALTENFVCQSLSSQGIVPCYYSNSISRLEIDFLIEYGKYVLPIEAKADENLKSKSFKSLISSSKDIPFGIRFSLKPLKLNGKILNIPLYMIDFIDSLIKQALKSVK